MGHDILISIDHQIEAQFYDVLLKYIGANTPKIHNKESDKKNGVRVVLSHANSKITKSQIKTFARSRLYFFKHTIVLDVEPARIVYQALMDSLADLGPKTSHVRNLLADYFECIKENSETYSHRLTILEDIYRELQKDALTHTEAHSLCNCFLETDRTSKV